MDHTGVIITDGATQYRVTVRRGVEVELSGPTDMQAFMDWWREQASLRNVRWSPDSQDYGIAKRLLNQHGLDSLKRRSILFWRRYSDPLCSGEYDRHMVLLSAKMQEVEHDLSTLVE